MGSAKDLLELLLVTEDDFFGEGTGSVFSFTTFSTFFLVTNFFTLLLAAVMGASTTVSADSEVSSASSAGNTVGGAGVIQTPLLKASDLGECGTNNVTGDVPRVLGQQPNGNNQNQNRNCDGSEIIYILRILFPSANVYFVGPFLEVPRVTNSNIYTGTTYLEALPLFIELSIWKYTH